MPNILGANPTGSFCPDLKARGFHAWSRLPSFTNLITVTHVVNARIPKNITRSCNEPSTSWGLNKCTLRSALHRAQSAFQRVVLVRDYAETKPPAEEPS